MDTRKKRSDKKKQMSLDMRMINILAGVFVLLLVYLIGFGTGQASVYKKQNDKVSIEQIYED
jgi:cell division protein FtsB